MRVVYKDKDGSKARSRAGREKHAMNRWRDPIRFRQIGWQLNSAMTFSQWNLVLKWLCLASHRTSSGTEQGKNSLASMRQVLIDSNFLVNSQGILKKKKCVCSVSCARCVLRAWRKQRSKATCGCVFVSCLFVGQLFGPTRQRFWKRSSNKVRSNHGKQQQERLNCLLALRVKGVKALCKNIHNPGCMVQDDDYLNHIAWQNFMGKSRIPLLHCIWKHKELSTDPVEGSGYFRIDPF